MKGFVRLLVINNPGPKVCQDGRFEMKKGGGCFFSSFEAAD